MFWNTFYFLARWCPWVLLLKHICEERQRYLIYAPNYIHVPMYMCGPMYMYTHLHVYIYTYIYIHIYIHTSISCVSRRDHFVHGGALLGMILQLCRDLRLGSLPYTHIHTRTHTQVPKVPVRMIVRLKFISVSKSQWKHSWQYRRRSITNQLQIWFVLNLKSKIEVEGLRCSFHRPVKTGRVSGPATENKCCRVCGPATENKCCHWHLSLVWRRCF